MFSLIKQVFTVFLSFSSSLARDRTKCLSLNNERCMFRPTLIDLNPIELKYYPFMISLHKCNGICNVLSPKMCVLKKTKNINVKVFYMITNKIEAKTMTKHICDCKCKFSSTTCNSNQNWNYKTCQCECKNYPKCKKDYSCRSFCTYHNCENSRYLKSIADTSVIEWVEMISVMDIVSTKKTSTIATNVTKNSHSKKTRYKFDCYILHIVLLVIILILMITIICYHYAKHESK